MKKSLICVAAMLALSSAAYADDTITLGASVQESGALANTGRYYRDGYSFAVDKINANGGIKVGGKTYKLALKLLDNQSDSNLSVRQYVQLLTQDKVNFLLGPFASDFVLADSSVAEKYQVPMIQGGGASGQIFSRGYKYIFGTLPAAGKYFDSTFALMAKLNPAPKSVALLYADDAFDVSVAAGTRDLIQQNGLKLTEDKRYSSNTSDFSSLISEVKASNPDAILVSGHETEVLNFIRQAKSLNLSPKLYSFTVGVPTADFRKALGADGNYAFGMTPWLPSPSNRDEYFGNGPDFASAYAQKFGYQPDYHAASAVADVEAFAKAIEAAGSLDPKKVRDAIAQVNFPSEYGKIAFNATGQIELPQAVIQVQDGQVRPIFAQGNMLFNPQYPMPAWDKR